VLHLLLTAAFLMVGTRGSVLIVEIRDRNDQPVAGAVVRFAIRNGRARFSGARNLTVFTNAAGRAAATGLVPTGNGVLQIGASAAFQRQTAAVTIAQTNVMTLAQAAAVSGCCPARTCARTAAGRSGPISPAPDRSSTMSRFADARATASRLFAVVAVAAHQGALASSRRRQAPPCASSSSKARMPAGIWQHARVSC
jgi:hypothetical protein